MNLPEADRRLHSGMFYGLPNRARRTRSLAVSTTSYQPRAVIPAHSHREAYISFVLEGTYVEHVGGRTLE